MLKQLVFVILLGMLTAACSHEQVYNAVQENRQQEECAKLPQAQYEQCMRQYGQSYDDYERQRREALEAEKALP